MKVYEMHQMNDTRLPFIIHTTTLHASHRSSLDGNWHENVELLCFIEGEGAVRLDGKRLSVCKGDVVVANANCLHSIETDTRLVYHYLIVDRSFCLANHFDTNTLRFREHIRDGELFDAYAELLREHQSDKESPFYVQRVRARVLLLSK